MALGLRLLALLPLLAPSVARAQTPPEPAPAPPPDETAVLEPPTPQTDTSIPVPAGAPPITEPVVVRVLLQIGADGTVTHVEIESPPQPPFDDAVLQAAQAFRFAPARQNGEPVAVQIAYTHTFRPPPTPQPPPAGEGAAPTAAEPTAQTGPARTSALRGRLVELGTREPVTGATVVAELGGHEYTAVTDDAGRFRVELPPGTARIRVHSDRHRPFLQRETIEPDEEVAVTYSIERERYDPYETVVHGTQRREEVSRVTLRGREITQVPGTFGDPFRVIQTLPGVVSAISLLPFPIVRGASPSSTGFLLDGTRVPLLYHLLAGPSVVHPEFIDEVQFYPGGAPVLYGGYTGGIVDGRTRRARSDEHLIDADVNLLQTGVLVRQPIRPLGLSVTAAARYGYPGLLLSLATDQASLQYWDYQLRIDGGSARNGWTVFAFGARDQLDTVAPDADPNAPNPKLAPALILGFHRLDLRGHLGSGRLSGTARVVLGADQTESAGASVSTWIVEPSLRGQWRVANGLTLVAGLEGSLHDLSEGTSSSTSNDDVTLSSLTGGLDRTWVGSALVESLWRPSPRWLVRPGVRADLYDDETTRKTAVDPRLTVRYRLLTRDLAEVAPDDEASGVWLKGAVGVYHQPPRFVLPLPGLDLMPLDVGLLQSIQTSLGVEVPFENHFSVSVEGYYGYLDPTIFDLSVNAADLGTTANTSLLPTTTDAGTSDAQEALDRLLEPQQGRTYGLEALVRRQSRTGVYGWISYTLSRSERRRNGRWAPYDFDRTHILNLVTGIPLPRNWDLSLRFQYQSGKPTTTTAGYNTARTDGYARIDLRIDKRAVFYGWLLDFYVDVTNVALLPEEVAPGATMRYVLPTAGLRGRF